MHEGLTEDQNLTKLNVDEPGIVAYGLIDVFGTLIGEVGEGLTEFPVRLRSTLFVSLLNSGIRKLRSV